MTGDPRRAHPNAEAIRSHVEGIVASTGFARSKRLAGFLRWVVEQALAGDTETITERNIGIEVYGRPSDFDSKADGTVRAEAIRLRHKLREYYESSGNSQRIDIPKGGYEPTFSGFDVSPLTVEHALPGLPATSRLPALCLVCSLAVLALGLIQVGSPPDAGISLRRAKQLAGEAIRLIRICDNIRAADLSRQAVALAPGDAMSHRVLSRALMNLGHDTDSIVEARIAESLAPAGSEEAGQSAAQRRLAELDPAKALDLYRQLLASHPASFDLLLYVAQAQIRALHFDAAMAAIERARRLPEAAGSSELDRLAALALGNLAMTRQSLLPEALASVRRAKASAEASHSQAAIGRVVLLEGGLESNMGLLANSVESLQTSREICSEVHDDLCVAATYRVQGNQRIAWGQYSAALHMYDQALAMALHWQNRSETSNVLQGIEAATEGLSKLDRPQPIPVSLAPEPPAKIR